MPDPAVAVDQPRPLPAAESGGPVRLHLACGEVYLQGWINIDAVGDLATERPDLVEANATDLEHYFKKPYRKRLLGHDKRSRYVVDLRAEVHDLPMFANGSVGEILTVNLIDHLRLQDLPAAVAEWRRVLADEGRLTIDVGDARGNAELLVAATNRDEFEWALRLTYCHSRDLYDSHHWGYTPEYLDELMAGWGFAQVLDPPGLHRARLSQLPVLLREDARRMRWSCLTTRPALRRLDGRR